MVFDTETRNIALWETGWYDIPSAEFPYHLCYFFHDKTIMKILE